MNARPGLIHPSMEGIEERMSHDIQQTEGHRRATIDGKPVVSHLLPQDSEPPANFPVDGIQRAIYMAFSTRFDGKTIITGCGIGRINGDTRSDIELTDVGNAALKVVGAHCENLFFCECRNVSTAKQRAIAALKAAKDGSGVFIVCKNSEIYDEVNLIRLFGAEKMGSGAPLPADFYEASVSDPHLNLKMADVSKTTPTAPSDGLHPLSLQWAKAGRRRFHQDTTFLRVRTTRRWIGRTQVRWRNAVRPGRRPRGEGRASVCR